MDRCAIFVDAGYLMAEGGWLCCGTKKRPAFACDYSGLIGALGRFAAERSGLPVLRTYWYDGARDGIPTVDHLAIADLPDVKVRLGRVVNNSQKGVDSLLIRDLIVLAYQRAIATAYLVSGDEDVREGVAAAQDTGMRVVLVGIESAGHNQARSLMREVDESVILGREFWCPYFELLEPAIAALGEAGDGAAVLTAAGHAADPVAVGEAFGRSWAEHAVPDELQRIGSQYPRVPTELDAQLLRAAERQLGDLRGREGTRAELRAGFWRGVGQRPAPAPGERPAPASERVTAPRAPEDPPQRPSP